MEDVKIDRLLADKERHESKSSAQMQGTSEASVVLWRHIFWEGRFLENTTFDHSYALVPVSKQEHQGYQT